MGFWVFRGVVGGVLRLCSLLVAFRAEKGFAIGERWLAGCAVRLHRSRQSESFRGGFAQVVPMR